MSGVVKGLDKAVQSMELQKVKFVLKLAIMKLFICDINC